MGTSLAGLLPQNTYSGLLKFGDNAALSATLRAISDGAGNDTMLSISTTALQIGGATGLNWDDTNKRLGIGTNAPTQVLDLVRSSGQGAIRFFNTAHSINTIQSGSTFRIFNNTAGTPAASVGFFQNINNQIGINTNNPTASLNVQGSGSTSATTSLLVQNSAGFNALKITDDGSTKIGGNGTNGKLYFGRASDSTDIGAIEIPSSQHFVFTEASGNGFRFADGFGKFPMFLANGKASVNKNAIAETCAQFEVVSTTGGVLFPRMTTTEKNAISTPLAGLVVYDSTAKSPAYYDGTNWGYTGGALQNTTGNGGTLNVSFAAGNIVNLTLNATTTLTFANAVIGTYIVQVTQSAGGGSSLVYPASVKWAGGTAPTLSTAVGKTDILTFYHDGTNYYGTYSLNY